MEISDKQWGKKYILLESSSSFYICATIFSYNALSRNNEENQQTIIS